MHRRANGATSLNSAAGQLAVLSGCLSSRSWAPGVFGAMVSAMGNTIPPGTLESAEDGSRLVMTSIITMPKEYTSEPSVKRPQRSYSGHL